MHGDRAAQLKRKARRRIEETADRAAKNLIKIDSNETESAETRFKATLQLLDRADVNAKTSIDVEVSAKPWEQVMEGMVDRIEITSGDHYLRSVGELPPAKPTILAQRPAMTIRPCSPVARHATMTMEQAYEELARINAAAAARQRAASAGHARISRRTRRPQR